MREIIHDFSLQIKGASITPESYRSKRKSLRVVVNWRMLRIFGKADKRARSGPSTLGSYTGKKADKKATKADKNEPKRQTK